MVGVGALVDGGGSLMHDVLKPKSRFRMQNTECSWVFMNISSSIWSLQVNVAGHEQDTIELITLLC